MLDPQAAYPVDECVESRGRLSRQRPTGTRATEVPYVLRFWADYIDAHREQLSVSEWVSSRAPSGWPQRGDNLPYVDHMVVLLRSFGPPLANENCFNASGTSCGCSPVDPTQTYFSLRMRSSHAAG